MIGHKFESKLRDTFQPKILPENEEKTLRLLLLYDRRSQQRNHPLRHIGTAGYDSFPGCKFQKPAAVLHGMSLEKAARRFQRTTPDSVYSGPKINGSVL